MALTSVLLSTTTVLLHLLLVVVGTISGLYVPEGSTVVLETDFPDCPVHCQCSNENKTARCSVSFSNYSIDLLFPWQVEDLEIFGDGAAMKSVKTHSSLKSVIHTHAFVSSADLNRIFINLKHLDVSVVPISQILDDDLEGMSELTELSLAFNNISNIQPGAFNNLQKLEFLNLNGNRITSLSNGIFSELRSLKELHLAGNCLNTLTAHTLYGLSRLKDLFLQNNNLINIDSFLDNLTSLEKFDVSGNKISFVLNETVEKMSSFESIDISKNPFQCSCAIYYLMLDVHTNSSKYANRVTCSGPDDLIGSDFTTVTLEQLPCENPKIKTISESLEVMYQGNLELECIPEGIPPIVVYWLTPWGDTFTHPSVYETFSNTAELDKAKHDSEFYGVNLILTSHIYVKPSGSLHIDKFRGHFSGNFTCVLVSLMGHVNKTVHVGIVAKINDLYMETIFIGVYCACGMLVLAIIIGAVRYFVNKCLHSSDCNCCCCRCDDLEGSVKSDKIEEEEVAEVVFTCSDHPEDGSDFDPDFPPPDPPVNSPQGELSPEKCSTPSEIIDPDKMPPHIWDQLDEVRARLRFGAGRKIEKVRSYVGSITDTGSLKIRNMKDAGSMKLQTIKASSSHAATIMKKNVTSGMEQVKYGVQSIKEFCGTGEMGAGTVSMMSVTTDVDTKEQVKMVKSHTFV